MAKVKDSLQQIERALYGKNNKQALLIDLQEQIKNKKYLLQFEPSKKELEEVARLEQYEKDLKEQIKTEKIKNYLASQKLEKQARQEVEKALINNFTKTFINCFKRWGNIKSEVVSFLQKSEVIAHYIEEQKKAISESENIPTEVIENIDFINLYFKALEKVKKLYGGDIRKEQQDHLQEIRKRNKASQELRKSLKIATAKNIATIAFLNKIDRPKKPRY